MADLRTTFAGIQCPNPFWLASGPPTNTYGQVARAFDLGWGGAVWKTIGEPIINVFSRYGSVDLGATRMMGFNNIELITDRPIADNLREIAEVKRNYPKHAVIASLMVESKREAWHEMVARTVDTGADGIELNFGCPHGMSERGMGSAVGQVPDYTCQIVEWVKEVATIPVIVKLTPNVTDITYIARAAVKGGADALSLINTINSIVGVDLDTFAPYPSVAGKSSHGGYCGPAVKPIALHLVSAVAADPAVAHPDLRHRRYRHLARRRGVRGARRRHAAGLHRGHALRLPHHRGSDRRTRHLDGRGGPPHAGRRAREGAAQRGEVGGAGSQLPPRGRDRPGQVHRLSAVLHRVRGWRASGHQNLGTGDAGRGRGGPVVEIIEEACVGCNLCSEVCPVRGCITMRQVPNDSGPVTWKGYAAGKGKLAPRSAHFHTATWGTR